MTDYERIEADPTQRAELRKEELILAVTNAIAEEMDRQGLSKADLARRLGTTRSHVTQLLAGGRNLMLGSIAEIADAVGCKLEVRLVRHGRPAKRAAAERAKGKKPTRTAAAAKA